jgi:hypothetical protein
MQPFRRIRIEEKSPTSLVMSVSLSVCSSAHPHVPARLPLDGFKSNFMMGTFMKICQEAPILWRELLWKSVEKLQFYGGNFRENLSRSSNFFFKSDKNIGHWTWNPEYLLLSRRHKFAIKHFCAYLNIFILLQDTHSIFILLQDTHNSPYFISMATLVTLKCHSVTVHVHCLLCL